MELDHRFQTPSVISEAPVTLLSVPTIASVVTDDPDPNPDPSEVPTTDPTA